MKKFFGLLLMTFMLSACDRSANDQSTLRVGTIAGPETALMEQARDVAQQRYGLHIEIVTFTDYLRPNMAVIDGTLDANMVEHRPYLDSLVQTRHYDLVAVGNTFIYPMGIYSKKITQLSQLQYGDIVGIPNDPTNEGRALLLLQRAQLITLNPTSGLIPTLNDILSNPHKLIFKELDAALLPRALNDAVLAVINTNYAIPAGLFPAKDALFIEDKQSPYVNVIVAKKANSDDPRIKKLVAAFQSQEVVAKAQQLFPDGAAIPGW